MQRPGRRAGGRADIAFALSQRGISRNYIGWKRGYRCFDILRKLGDDFRVKLGNVVTFRRIKLQVIELGALEPRACSRSGRTVVEIDFTFGALSNAQLPLSFANAV